jgi:hypothetical protein
MTNVERFKKANAVSPVVKAQSVPGGGRGGVYTLEDGKTFTFSADECMLIRPRWKYV